MSKPDPADESVPMGAMLMDDSPIPAPFSLTRPQELPPFEVDEFKMPFAIADDREDHGDQERVAGKPLTLREPEPN